MQHSMISGSIWTNTAGHDMFFSFKLSFSNLKIEKSKTQRFSFFKIRKSQKTQRFKKFKIRKV